MKKSKLKLTTTSMGALTAIIAPVAALVSCGSSSGGDEQDKGGDQQNNVANYKVLPTYTGQADQLIALGINADYYPLQLSQPAPFDYLTSPEKYMKGQEEGFKKAFSKKIKSLLPSTQGVSWWNQQALQDGEKGSDPEHWKHISGDLVLYEHYLLDDGAKTIDNDTAPRHTNYKETFIETNFRASRDPYTRLPKGIIEGTFHQDIYDKLKTATDDDSKSGVAFINKMLEVARAIEGTSASEKAVDGKNLPSGKATREATDEESWIYNDFVFARAWHNNFEDNKQFIDTSFDEWVLEQRNANNKDVNWAFDKDPTKDAELAKLFFESTFQPTEEAAPFRLNEIAAKAYGGNGALALHHPIYEQQEELGGAPMFEGAMRDNSLYLYDLASKIQNAFTKDPQAVGTQALVHIFQNDARLSKFQSALANADKINKDLRARMASIKILVDKLAAKNNNVAPTFGIVTIAPGGGVSTIQSSSKYSFIYKELGFSQPLPKAFPTDVLKSDGTFSKDSFYNMDDNGWWWNISTPGDEERVSDTRVNEFDKFDYGVLTANDKQYTGVLKDNDKITLGKLFGTDKSGLTNFKRDYNLWNEGLKTPFVVHMILDEVVDQIKANAKTDGATDDEIKAANDWGNYFTKDFLA